MLKKHYSYFFTILVSAFAHYDAIATKPDREYTERWLLDQVDAQKPSPPDGATNIQTMAGVDIDADGIRDDIEDRIRTWYPLDEQKYIRNSLYNIALFYQIILTETNLDFHLGWGGYTALWVAPSLCLKNDFSSPREAFEAETKVKAYTLNSMPRINRFFDLTDTLEREYESGLFWIQYYKNRGQLPRNDFACDPVLNPSLDKCNRTAWASVFCLGGASRNNLSFKF